MRRFSINGVILLPAVVVSWISSGTPTFVHRGGAIASVGEQGAARTTSEPTSDFELRGLYPPSAASRNGSLNVDELHTLYFEVHGRESDSQSEPLVALFLHGGPGAGCTPNHARFFDRDKYDVVLLDQRGSGRSEPRGEVRNNTLLQLVEDCEALRRHLDIGRWDVVLGGSWGTTLALAYAQSYPSSVRAMILRGVCLFRSCEINYLFSSDGGAARSYPNQWKAFEEAVGVDPASSASYPRSALHAYYNKLMSSSSDDLFATSRSWMQWEFFMSVSHKLPTSVNSSDYNATMAAIKAWDDKSSPVAVHTCDGGWEYRETMRSDCSTSENIFNSTTRIEIENLRQRIGDGRYLGDVEENQPIYVERTVTDAEKGKKPAQTILTCFYSANDKHCMDYRDLLDGASIERIRAIPCVAVQGGNDRICPPDSALDLLEGFPEMELRIPIRAGHSMYDPFITHELVEATDRFANYFVKDDNQG